MLTEEQRIKRINGIGASDSPIIMGYSNYKTPYELYLEKTGKVDLDDEVTEQQYWGNALEPIILKRFEEENNVKLAFPDTVYHPQYSFIFANLDGWIETEKAVVEAKTVNVFQRKEWDMRLNDGIPLSYLIQIAKQCAITNATRGYCAVLIGGMEYRQFIYERDLELESAIIQADIDFWNCVQNRIEPEPINTADCRLKFPTPSPNKIAYANYSSLNYVNKLLEVKSKIKTLESEEEQCKINLMQLMGDSEYLEGFDGEILATWKATKKGNRVFNLK